MIQDYNKAMEIAAMDPKELGIEWLRQKEKPEWSPSLVLAIMAFQIKHGKPQLFACSDPARLQKLIYNIRFECGVRVVYKATEKDDTGKNIQVDDVDFRMMKKRTIYLLQLQ